MTGELPLENLMQKVALKDRAAFADLYNRTSAKLFGVCLRILNNRAEAEDALQEAYAKIWRSAGQYSQTKAKPISWLAAIARNQSIDKIRTRRHAGDDLDAASDVPDGNPSPEMSTIAASDRQQLHDCVEELEEKHAAAIRAAYFGGATYEVLAKQTGVPLGTMKSWIRRSLMKLKDCLER